MHLCILARHRGRQRPAESPAIDADPLKATAPPFITNRMIFALSIMYLVFDDISTSHLVRAQSTSRTDLR